MYYHFIRTYTVLSFYLVFMFVYMKVSLGICLVLDVSNGVCQAFCARSPSTGSSRLGKAETLLINYPLRFTSS